MKKHNYETLGALLKAIVDDGLDVRTDSGIKIRYDLTTSRLTIGGQPLTYLGGWRSWLIKPDWRDEVSPDNKRLCWLSNIRANPTVEAFGDCDKVIRYEKSDYYPYKAKYGSWKYATPVDPVKDNVWMGGCDDI